MDLGLLPPYTASPLECPVYDKGRHKLLVMTLQHSYISLEEIGATLRNKALAKDEWRKQQ